MIKMNDKKIIDEWLQKATDRSSPDALDPEILYSNFAKITDNAKINICDGIIDLAKDVFGPAGGYYLSCRGDGQTAATELIVRKSKDGHNFIKNIKTLDRPSQSIISIIKGYTEYVSDASNIQTSKDGTTSLALIGSAISKYVLTERELALVEGDPNKIRKIPSTMYNLIFDLIKEEGTKLIKENLVPIYDESSKTYIKDGKTLLKKALATTTDNDPILLDAFLNVIEYADKNGININEAFLQPVESQEGPAKIEMKFKTGFKAPCSSISRELAGGFENIRSMVFVLDGFVEAHNEKLFIMGLTNFIKNQILPFNINSDFIFDATKQNKMEILFLVTRTPQTLVERYIKLASEGISTAIMQGGRRIELSVKPRFLNIRNDEHFIAHYEDIMRMFKGSKIDITKISEAINSMRSVDKFDFTAGRWFEAKTEEGINPTSFFPVIDGNQLMKFIYIESNPLEYDVDGTVVKFKNIIKKQNEENNGFEMDTVNIEDLICDASYTGTDVYLMPLSDSVIEAGNKIKNELIELKNSYQQGTYEDTTLLDMRIDKFNSVSMYPIIYSMSESEYTQLKTLYDDAMGIFLSVHVHGVMPGANTFIPKNITELNERVMNRLNQLLSKVGEIQKNKYMIFTQMLIKSIFNGYMLIYSLLDEDYEEHMQELINRKSDVLLTFNVVSGRFEYEVIESAATTRDIFVASLSITKDILMTNRLEISSKDISEVIVKNKFKTFHPINLVLATQDAKDIKDKYEKFINLTGGF